jgi:hypothetical protein
MVVVVGFCKIKVDSYFLIVLKIKCTKFHQDLSKTVDLHTKYTNRHSVLYITDIDWQESEYFSGNTCRNLKSDFRVRAYENLQTL